MAFLRTFLISRTGQVNSRFLMSLALVLMLIGGFLFMVRSTTTTSRLLATIASLEKRTGDLEEYIRKNVSSTARSQTPLSARPEVRSQEELLTTGVTQVAPAVVSIVVTKDVPKLEIVYENPFGDDPLYEDLGIRIPRYRQKGLETQRVGAGTGFIVRSDGYILTNRHVLQDSSASYTVLLSDGTQRPAQVVYRDPTFDIALLKIEGNNYAQVTLGDSDSLKLGQSVFAVGNALGEYNNSVSLGIISGLNRTVQASDGRQLETLSGVIQTDAAINPGNSGGPLVAFDGKVVGINVATVVGSNNISFAIPINGARKILTPILGQL